VTPAYLDAVEQVWYRFGGTAGQTVSIGTDIVNGGDNTDTYLELYFECGGSLLAGDDDGGPGFYSLISNFVLPSTGNYDIKVRGYNGSSAGPYSLFVTTPPPPPENDTCANGLPIERCTAGSLNGDLSLARNDYSPTNNCTGFTANGKDVVYTLGLQAGDAVDLYYIQDCCDASFYILTDCGNMNSCVAGADAGVTGDPETINYVAPSTGTYYLILDTYGTDTGGAWTLDYNISCQGPPSGACCVPGADCQVVTQEVCERLGGSYQGDNTDCDPDPCGAVPTQNTTWGKMKNLYR
jgi:hypothetical protein